MGDDLFATYSPPSAAEMRRLFQRGAAVGLLGFALGYAFVAVIDWIMGG